MTGGFPERWSLICWFCFCFVFHFNCTFGTDYSTVLSQVMLLFQSECPLHLFILKVTSDWVLLTVKFVPYVVVCWIVQLTCFFLFAIVSRAFLFFFYFVCLFHLFFVQLVLSFGLVCLSFCLAVKEIWRSVKLSQSLYIKLCESETDFTPLTLYSQSVCRHYRCILQMTLSWGPPDACCINKSSTMMSWQKQTEFPCVYTKAKRSHTR